MKFHSLPGCTTIRQYPSDTSYLLKHTGLLSGASARYSITQGIALQSCPRASGGGGGLVFKPLTDGCTTLWPIFTEKDRLMIMRGRRSFWRIAAVEEIFSLFRSFLSFMSSHSTVVSNPAAFRYSMSSLNSSQASGVQAVGCGPFFTIFSRCSHDQSAPQSISTSWTAHSSNVSPNG